MPPGDLISYSNHGIALAGYLVERASGQPFAEYVKEHILQPLGMRRSGFGLPTPPPPELAVPYDYKDGKYVPVGYDRLLIGPAGELYTSAGDIARFMLAHLQDGQLGEARILAEETARAMHSQQFTHYPRLQGLCYGFVEDQRNDVRIIWHNGGGRGFGTLLVLVPEANLGLFVSTTRDFDVRFFITLPERFFDRYFPRAEPLSRPEPPADFASRAWRFTGSYVPNRHVRGDFLKLGLFSSEFRVIADDGALLIRVPNDILDPIRLVEVEPLLFEVVDKGRYVSFRTDASGRVTHLLADGGAYDKIAWYQSPRVHTILAALCGLLFVGTVLGWTLGVIVRWVAGGPASGVPRLARRLGFVVSLLNAGFLAWVSIAFRTISPYVLFEGVPVSVIAFCTIPLVSIPLSLGLPYFLVRSLGEAGWTPLARLHYTFLTLAAFLFAGWVWYWNLLGVGF
jgi:hypothetical protein